MDMLIEQLAVRVAAAADDDQLQARWDRETFPGWRMLAEDADRVLATHPGCARVDYADEWERHGRRIRAGARGLRLRDDGALVFPFTQTAAITAPTAADRRARRVSAELERAADAYGVHVFRGGVTRPRPDLHPQLQRHINGYLLRNAGSGVCERVYVGDPADRANARPIDYIATYPGIPAGREACALAHEFAHVLFGHLTDKSDPQPVRELQAETVSFLVCGTFGVADIDQSACYLLHWAGIRAADLLDEHRDVIAGCAERMLELTVAVPAAE